MNDTHSIPYYYYYYLVILFFSFWCANYFTSLLQAPNFVGGTFGISLQPLLNISNHTLIEKSQVHITVNYLQ